MRTRLIVCVFCLLCVAGANAGTVESTAADRKHISVTIYNVNLGLVRESRVLSLPGGVVRLEFRDVASRIDPTSVKVRVLGGLKEFGLLEQNYEFDLMSPEKLMEKYVGRDIELVVSHPQTGEETSLRAELLSMNGGPIYRIGDEIHIGHPGRVVLPGIPENLIPRPTLVWTVKARSGTGEVETTYLTSGMSWKADYVAELGPRDETMDLIGWVTLTNTSGAGYEDARIKLVAGDVRRVETAPVESIRKSRMLYAADMAVEEEPFFEYHLYTLPGPTTLKDNQTKQVEFLAARGVELAKEYVLPPRAGRFQPLSRLGEIEKEHVIVTIRFHNDEAKGLGVPLPAGTFRFYKRDSEGELHFVGENRIDHVPRGEELALEVGKAFDILAERVETDFQIIRQEKIYEHGYTVTLRNAKDEAVTVKVLEDIFGDWEVLESSHTWTKEAANRLSFTVPVPKDGEAKLVYRVRIKMP
ncbi:MAG TPA: DUF4139 domain-containing protein [Patescibacteria group bacterium]|nr:DUF4139 domain-containing protein [Patescibacteria group bacterium]